MLYIALVLPYRICFNLTEGKPTKIFDTIIDVTFLIDLVITFFSETFDDKEFRVIDNHKEMALRYLKSWFVPVLLSVVPFDLLLIARFILILYEATFLYNDTECWSPPILQASHHLIQQSPRMRAQNQNNWKVAGCIPLSAQS